jgi:hypothetical protein
MDAEASLRQFGLVPSDDALPHVRALLAQETAAEREGRPREEDLALLCCVQLFSRGLLEDVLRIWKAKSSGMDLGATVDIQLLCGAGLEATRSYLASQEGPAAADALEYLAECEQAGDFEDFSPAELLDDYRHYFDLT